MRETLGILLGFFLAAALGYLISGIRQKEQEKEILESYMDSFKKNKIAVTLVIKLVVILRELCDIDRHIV